MNKLFNLITKLLISIITILFFVFIAFVIYFIYLSQSNDIDFDDSLSYFVSPDTQNLSFTLTDKNSVNLDFSDNQNTVKNTTNSTATSTAYYYNQLDTTSKTIYKSLENNIDNLKKENYTINFSTTFDNILNKSNGQEILNTAFQTALDAFFYDHPELFYIDLSKISLFVKYTSIGSKTTYKVSLAPLNNKNYLSDGFNSEAQVDIAISKVENVRDNLIKTISNSSSDYDKALKVHDVLVNSLEYDNSTTKINTHNIYGALIQNSVVCEGYAKSFKYILDSLGIECILVNGNATNSSGETEAHMWNYIKLNENWYGVDVTWDDPIIVGGFTKNIIRHNYFCKGTNVFNKSHVISRQISETGMYFSFPTLSNLD